MAKADSTVRVNIIGDAKGLQTELGKADKGLKGFAGSAKGLLAGAAFVGVAAGVADFAATALAEGDRLGDATTNLELQLGALSDQLVDSADDFSELGSSAQDILELEVAFANVATAAGVTDEVIADIADEAAATASALALITDLDADVAMDLITKAAGGGKKALKELGIELDPVQVTTAALAISGKDSADALTEADIAAGRFKVVLEELKPKLDAVNEGGGDVEQSMATLEAKWETLTGKIGQGLDGPLNDFLSWTLQGYEGLEKLGGLLDGTSTVNFSREMAEATIATHPLIEGLREIVRLLGLSGTAPTVLDSAPRGGLRGLQPGARPGVTINVQPRDGADTERAVVNALRDHNRRSGREILERAVAAYIRTADVAQRVGLAPSAIRAIDPAQLPYVAVGRRGIRMYRAIDVEDYVSSRRVANRDRADQLTVRRR